MRELFLLKPLVFDLTNLVKYNNEERFEMKKQLIIYLSQGLYFTFYLYYGIFYSNIHLHWSYLAIGDTLDQLI